MARGPMHRPRTSSKKALYGLVATGLAVSCAIPLVAEAAVAPKATTGAATAVRGTSATLTGAVDPGGASTSYSFQYGPTIAYGKQTTPGQLPAGTAKVKVGQPITGLAAGYHYRLVATNNVATAYGKDRTYGVKKKRATRNKFTLPKTSTPTVYGSTYVLSGTLSGAGNANRAVVLQASPYPFLEAFTTLGLPAHTDAAGRFSFRVPNLVKTTQFRVSTVDPRPLYSRVVTQSVGVKVTLRVRSSGHRGLVRLYGTVTPARPGARVDFQLFKQVRPGKSEKSEERTGRFSTQFSTTVKRGTPAVSRFSSVVTVQRGGSYRAYVDLRSKLAVGPGYSHTVLLHGAPSTKTKR